MKSRMFTPKSYEILIETIEDFKKRQTEEAALPYFTVKLTHPVSCTDLISFDEECIKNPTPGVTYKREGASDITISIAMSNNPENQDRKFRQAVSIHTRYRLKSSECDLIIKAYVKHVRDSKLALDVLKDFNPETPSHKYYSHPSPTHNQAH